jgi:hypothetical protein
MQKIKQTKFLLVMFAISALVFNGCRKDELAPKDIATSSNEKPSTHLKTEVVPYTVTHGTPICFVRTMPQARRYGQLGWLPIQPK